MSKLIFTTYLFQAKLQWFLFLVWIQILGPFCHLWSPQVSALPCLRLELKVVVCTDWLTDWLRYDCHSIRYCTWEYFGAVCSGALCSVLSPMHMYSTLHLHCFMKCSRNGIFYCQYMWYYQYFSWARTISNFVTMQICVFLRQVLFWFILHFD